MESIKYLLIALFFMVLFGVAGILFFPQFKLAPATEPGSDFSAFKEEAIRGTAKANLHLLRSVLAAYAAGSEDVLYPVGDYNYDQLRVILPPNLLTNLPETLKDAKWAEGSFSYSSKTGETYSIVVGVNSAQGGVFTGTPKETIYSNDNS